ncbi:hypothetical protein CYB_0013 [Synechococcus sp. JA-2-3B'a(2-13)]|nr:hypothetical protein CYB_0013 [Synechococcus sp. JA-2-3B'a(2-13)]
MGGEANPVGCRSLAASQSLHSRVKGIQLCAKDYLGY